MSRLRAVDPERTQVVLRLCLWLWSTAVVLCGSGALRAETQLPASGAAAIALEAEAAHQFYRQGASNEIFVQARVRPAPAREGTPPAPRTIVFVLDRSGSMDGERMAATQEAVTRAMGTLAATDTVAVVLFGSEVETLLEAQPSPQARAAFALLQPIESVGGAALYEGLSQGGAQARRFAGPGSVTQLILVSDGPPTRGPRERVDLVRLVESFVRDGITVSTVGLGEECDEDMLAAIARSGGGRFLLAGAADQVDEAVRELLPADGAVVVGHEASVTMEYRPICEKIAAHGGHAVAVARTAITWRIPRLIAGQDLSLLGSGVLEAFGTIGIQRDLVRVTLRWTDPSTGEKHERVSAVTIRFLADSRDLAGLYNIDVYRAAAAALVTEGLQDAIDSIDRGDARRALRDLRRARERLLDLNHTPRDAQIAAITAGLEAFIATAQPRGLGPLDRKLLRSGLGGRFEMPMPEEERRGP